MTGERRWTVRWIYRQFDGRIQTMDHKNNQMWTGWNFWTNWRWKRPGINLGKIGRQHRGHLFDNLIKMLDGRIQMSIKNTILSWEWPWVSPDDITQDAQYNFCISTRPHDGPCDLDDDSQCPWNEFQTIWINYSNLDLIKFCRRSPMKGLKSI